MNTNSVLGLIIQIGSFMSSFAAIAAGIIMARVTKKFGTGILANGFRSISIGVFFIAAGIITDSLVTYMAPFSSLTLIAILITIKEAFFVIGTYIIVIGSKRTGDKLETLTKT